MSASSSRRRFWITGTAVVALGAAAAAGFAVQAASKEPATAAATPPPAAVSVAEVVQRDVAAWSEYAGRLEAVERVDIRPRVAGTVQAVHFREGALVKKGDLLLTIDPAPYAAAVERAAAQVAAAEARAGHARSEQSRAKRLLSEDAISQREHDERTQASAEAEANLRAARAALQSAQLDLGYTAVRAPVAGRVGRLEITVGNVVASGPSAPVLTTLVSVNPIYASFEADERAIDAALRGLGAARGGALALERIPVQMGTADDAETPHVGKLQLVDNQVDAKSGTVRVRAVFDNADGTLRAGQFARVKLGRAHAEPVVLVSERAIGTDQSKKYVMVVGTDSKAAYREVTLGSHADGLRIVSAGLKAGERVIVNGLQRVRPGAPVAPELVPMQARTAAPDSAPRLARS